MSALSFSTVVERLPGDELWTVLVMPFDVEQVFGTKGSVRVRGTINGVPFRRSIHPRDDGRHFMMLNRQMREEAGMMVGEPVQVVMELDTGERTVEVPPDLAEALDADAAFGEAYAKLAHSRRFEFVRWLNGTKNPETRQRRIARIKEMVAAGESLRPPRRKKSAE